MQFSLLFVLAEKSLRVTLTYKIMLLSPVSLGVCIMSPNLVAISLIMLKGVIIPPGIGKTVMYWGITLCDANCTFHRDGDL